MIKIKSEDLRKAVQAAYEFDKYYGDYMGGGDGQFTENFRHETYAFDGKARTYYFDGDVLFSYEDL